MAAAHISREEAAGTSGREKLQRAVRELGLRGARTSLSLSQMAARRYSLGRHSDDRGSCLEISMDNNLVGVDITTPDVEAGRIMLYFHGGAHVVGSMWYYTDFLRRMSAATKMRIVSVDYRLAPEHRFPAGLDDALCAYRWLRRDQPGASIVVAGDSAGGNLAIALMVRLAMQGEQLPDACVGLAPWLLLCPNLVTQRKERKSYVSPLESNELAPWLNPYLGGDNDNENTCKVAKAASRDQPARSRGAFVRTVQAVQDSILWQKGAEMFAAEYVGGHDATNPLVSPLLASDEIVKQFPPIHLQVDQDEPLYHDSEELVARCRELNVTAEMQVFQDTHHVFQLNNIVFREKARQSLEHISAFLDKCCMHRAQKSLRE